MFNIELWCRTEQQPIAKTIRERKWRWIGHTLRGDQTNIARLALDWNLQLGRRKRGRPVIIWRRTLKKELRAIHMTWGEAKKNAQDRKAWRSAVEAVCPEQGEEDIK